LSARNLALSVIVIVGIPLTVRAMGSRDLVAPGDGSDVAQPGAENESRIDHGAASAQTDSVAPPADSSDEPGVAAWLGRSSVVPLLMVALVVVALVYQFWQHGTRAIGLNFVNLFFLAGGLVLHRNLGAYFSALAEGGRAVAGIVLQFPLYAGIQGVMSGAGIAAAISHGFVDASQWIASGLGIDPLGPFSVATFVSAGLVNLFVPSGGGQWIVQGPIMCSAALDLSLPLERTVLAVAYGDQWTNMIQPFWAIPLMGLTNVSVRQFIGYCALLMLLAGPVFIVALLV
jgi:short-chain fatty acids transporter